MKNIIKKIISLIFAIIFFSFGVLIDIYDVVQWINIDLIIVAIYVPFITIGLEKDRIDEEKNSELERLYQKLLRVFNYFFIENKKLGFELLNAFLNDESTKKTFGIFKVIYPNQNMEQKCEHGRYLLLEGDYLMSYEIETTIIIVFGKNSESDCINGLADNEKKRAILNNFFIDAKKYMDENQKYQ